MKKTIQKPENWQDFETLCKQLWGEIWGIPMKIKKNGRNGQSQAGVDVYGVPKGECQYWGIQCKGKDDYTGAKLTTNEIDNELAKAHNFKPDLSVLIFATTMNKDSVLEEYVRIKDLESRESGKFGILLFCWEDIADLIDDHQDTYNFWVGNKQHKTKFDFKVSLTDFQTEQTIRPKCIKTINRYILREPKIENLDDDVSSILANSNWIHKLPFPNRKMTSITQGRINEAICSFEVIMENTGANVIEDWRVNYRVKNEYKELFDQLGTGPLGMVDFSALEHKRTYVNENQISYSPKNNEPLIQKDNRFFEAHIIPECKEYTISIEWELLARDYNSSGTLFLKVEPEFENKIILVEVDSEEELKADEIVSVNEKKNYEDEN